MAMTCKLVKLPNSPDWGIFVRSRPPLGRAFRARVYSRRADAAPFTGFAEKSVSFGRGSAFPRWRVELTATPAQFEAVHIDAFHSCIGPSQGKLYLSVFGIKT